ncbi:hypothetical protein J6590_067161, partial [Homalodisca vitripennis]
MAGGGHNQGSNQSHHPKGACTSDPFCHVHTISSTALSSPAPQPITLPHFHKLLLWLHR